MKAKKNKHSQHQQSSEVRPQPKMSTSTAGAPTPPKKNLTAHYSELQSQKNKGVKGPETHEPHTAHTPPLPTHTNQTPHHPTPAPAQPAPTPQPQNTQHQKRKQDSRRAQTWMSRPNDDERKAETATHAKRDKTHHNPPPTQRTHATHAHGAETRSPSLLILSSLGGQKALEPHSRPRRGRGITCKRTVWPRPQKQRTRNKRVRAEGLITHGNIEASNKGKTNNKRHQ